VGGIVVAFKPVLWSPVGAPAGVPGPRRNADDCDAGWFAPVATRRRPIFGALSGRLRRGSQSPPGGRPPGTPRWGATAAVLPLGPRSRAGARPRSRAGARPRSRAGWGPGHGRAIAARRALPAPDPHEGYGTPPAPFPPLALPLLAASGSPPATLVSGQPCRSPCPARSPPGHGQHQPQLPDRPARPRGDPARRRPGVAWARSPVRAQAIPRSAPPPQPGGDGEGPASAATPELMHYRVPVSRRLITQIADLRLTVEPNRPEATIPRSHPPLTGTLFPSRPVILSL